MYCLLALISLGTILIDLICDSRHLFIYIKMSIKLVISKWGEKLKSATFKGFSNTCNKSYIAMSCCLNARIQYSKFEAISVNLWKQNKRLAKLKSKI